MTNSHKITFGEMREMGVRCPTSSRASPVRLAVPKELISGRTSIGNERPDKRQGRVMMLADTAAQLPRPRVEITSEMIKAAARAIRERAGGRSGFTGYRRPRPWKALPQSLRES